jgi:hypothetical protein
VKKAVVAYFNASCQLAYIITRFNGVHGIGCIVSFNVHGSQHATTERGPGYHALALKVLQM